MRKWFLLGLGAVLAVVGAFAFTASSDAQQAVPEMAVLSTADSAALKGPKQPIFFRHDVHAGQLQMACQYCHFSVAVSSEPGIPSMQTCMGCHAAISGKTEANKVEIKKLRDAWGKKEPIEWVRIHSLARHVHFPHEQHIKALGTNACATCHGNLARMPQVFQANNVNNMGFCINCHIERKVSRDCTVCHY